MPCNRRMNHNHPCGGFRFHPYSHPHHHPWFAHHDIMQDAVEEGVELAAALFGKDLTTRWNDNETNYVFEMDIPGVKARQVTIEESNGEVEVTAIRMSEDGQVAQTYQEVFYVSPKKSDLDNVLATVSEGVLTIVIPKKHQEPMEITVQTNMDPPVPLGEGQEFRVTLDLPGVKARDLKVQVRDEKKVFLEATRKMGDRTMSIRRAVAVEPNVDMNFGQAFLQQGVFTLVAPVIIEEEEETAKPSAVRAIAVQVEEEVATATAMESLTLEEDTNNDGGEMVVETVTEGDQGWEEVKEATKQEKKMSG